MNRKVVLITGASRGIGLACTRLLETHGYTVFGTSRHPDQYPDSLFPLVGLDVNDNESVRACVQNVIDREGHLDVLVNNAGISLSGAIEEASIDDVRAIFETNLFGTMRMTNTVLPHMRKQRSGLIINISSLAGLLSVPYLGIYTASKYALEGYSDSLRYEVRPFGIHVSLIEPGDTRTTIAGTPPANPIADYDGVRERTETIHLANVAQGLPPERVARVLKQIIETPQPRLRYPIMHGAEYFVPLLRHWLPGWLREFFLRKTYQLD